MQRWARGQIWAKYVCIKKWTMGTGWGLLHWHDRYYKEATEITVFCLFFFTPFLNIEVLWRFTEVWERCQTEKWKPSQWDSQQTLLPISNHDASKLNLRTCGCWYHNYKQHFLCLKQNIMEDHLFLYCAFKNLNIVSYFRYFYCHNT